MRISIYIFLFFLFAFTTTQAQSYWNNRYDFDYDATAAQGIVYDSLQNKYIVSGFAVNAPNTFNQFSYMLSLDAYGNVDYQKFVSLDDSAVFWYLPRTIKRSRNKTYAGGVYDKANGSIYDGLVVKYDANLDTMWTKRYSSGYTDTECVIASIDTKNDSIIIAGNLWKEDENGWLIDGYSFIMIADSNGNELKKTIYNTSAIRDDFYSVQVVKDKYIVAGSRQKWNPSNPYDYYDYHAIILLYSSDATLLKEYVSPVNDYIGGASWVIPTQNGGYVYAGIKGKYIPSGGNPAYVPLHRGYIQKLDANFNYLWSRTLSGVDTTTDSQFNKIIENPDGTLIAIGRDEQVMGGKHVQGWIVKLNANGQVIWQRHHQILSTPNEAHEFSDIVRTPDGGYALCGPAWDYSNQEPKGTYAWVCKTDSFGCLVPGCETVGISENTPLESSFKLYPNPASDRLFLYYNNPQLQNCVFAVRDIAGRQLVPPTPLENSTTYEMRIGDWAKGLYFVEVRDEKGRVFTEKFVKE